MDVVKKIFCRNPVGTTRLLQKSCVGIAGCGGLGSNAAVALTRAGIGKLILADFDIVEESNLNRQHFFLTDVGRPKVEALAGHLANINPRIELDLHQVRITPDNVLELFSDADLLIEAFDIAENKKWLIEVWSRAFPQKPIVAASGVGGYGRTERLRVVHTGNIHFCGDFETDMCAGLSSARVGIVANMQANLAIEILVERAKNDIRERK